MIAGGALLLSHGPIALAATGQYAESLVANSSANTFNPSYAVGAPDTMYVDFMDKNTYITLDFGSAIGLTGVNLTTTLLEFGAITRVYFLDENLNVLSSSSNYIPSGNNSSLSLAYGETTPFRYVKVESGDSKEWRLDSVELQGVAESVVEEPVVDDSGDEPVVTEPAVERAGQLIKSPESAAVYLVGDDGLRHAFPNEAVFRSWDYDFDEVEEVTAEELALFTLGKNVYFKPGEQLVKIVSDPKVYVVAPGGVLRHLTSESVAITLYGANWADKVADIADVFWRNYTVGEEVDEEEDLEGWEIEGRAY